MFISFPTVIHGVEDSDRVVSVYFGSSVEKLVVCICVLLNLSEDNGRYPLGVRLVNWSALGTEGHTYIHVDSF